MSVRRIDVTPYRDAFYSLVPLHKWDHKDARGRDRGKSPRDPLWLRREYLDKWIDRAVAEGFNIGVRLMAGELVIDYDPRNDPDTSGMAALVELVGKDFLESCPCVITGSGGRHWYCTKPPEIRLKNGVPEMPGVEFKSIGRQVVAAGSRHPNGEYYAWAEGSPPPCDAHAAPEALIELVRKPDRGEVGGAPGAGGGELDTEQLEALLAQLDPEDYRDHDAWLEVGMASYHATGGLGLVEFTAWSVSDPHYAGHDEIIRERWPTWAAEPGAEAVTVRTLYKHVRDAGGLVWAHRFPDDEIQLPPTAVFNRPVGRIVELSWDDICEYEAPAYLVQGLLVADGMSAVIGKPKTGKTYWTLALALSVATGRTFYGRDVTQGRVTYVCSEGGIARFRQRVAAWCRHHGIDSRTLNDRFGLVSSRVDLLTPENVKELLAALGGSRMLVVLDTLARTMGGNENAQEDMNHYVAACDRIREATEATVVVVHHVGKDAKRGSRGSSVLPGAIEAEITITKTAVGHVMCVTEDRHGASDQREVYRFEEVPEPGGRGGPVPGVLVREQDEVMEAKARREEELHRIRDHALDMDGEPSARLVDWVKNHMDKPKRTAQRLVAEALSEGSEAAVVHDGCLVWREKPEAESGNKPVIRVDEDAWLR